MFNKLFENYRYFLGTDDDRLLIEGRETDALNRVVKNIENKDIQEFLNDTMDQFLHLDPSGNQKYADWIAKILNKSAETAIFDVEKEGFAALDYIDSVKAGIGFTVQSIKQNLALYHKLTQRNLIEKDINKFGNAPDWSHAVYRANKELEQKERMKAMAKKAKSETDVLEDGEDYMIVRPRSAEGSCYFGQGTKWCISATQSQNYFGQYTAEGKGFYFVFFHHLPQDDDMKKMALVFEPGYDEPSEVFDRPDDEVGIDGLRGAVEGNLLMKGFWNSLPDKKAVKKIFNKKPEELKKIIEKLEHELEIFREGETVEGQPLSYKGAKLEVLTQSFKNLGINIEDNDDIEEEFDEMISNQLWEISGAAAHHWNENPAGPTEEEYQAIEDEYDLQHFYVSREEMDEGRMYWDAGTSFQFDDVDDLVEEAVDTDELRNFVDGALDGHYIYGEVEDNSYGGSIDISVRINPDHGEAEGIEGFSSFMETVASADKAWQDVYDTVIDSMKEAGWIPGESMKALLEKFNEMKFQNFDVEMEDGNVQMSSRLKVKILLPDELQIGRAKISSMAGKTRGDMAEDPRPLIKRRLYTHLNNTEYTQEIGKQIIDRLKDVLERAMKIAASQLKLPLNEEKTPLVVPEFNIQFGAMGPEKQGSVASSGVDGGDYDISDKYVYWLDIVIEGEETEEEVIMIQKFLRMIDKEEFFEKIRQYIEGLVNNQIQKQIMPRIRRELGATRSKEGEESTLATRVAQRRELRQENFSNIFENWRKFTK